MRKGERLYYYLSNQFKDKLFTEKNLAVANALFEMSDEEFDKAVNSTDNNL